MTPNQYVESIVKKHKLSDTIDDFTDSTIVAPLKELIRKWNGTYLCDIKLSGSRAKGTAIDIATDLDLFISLSSRTDSTLKEIYNSLYDYVVRQGISARKQNVSIGITYKNREIDLVPAKRQGQFGNDHSLYRRKADSWTKTNIDTHIHKVRNSGRITEIVALKIWRENHKLEFPSIYLECFVIEVLSRRNLYLHADNFKFLLEKIRDNIVSKKIIDPANSNNILSDELNYNEKKKLAIQANSSLSERDWESIIWWKNKEKPKLKSLFIVLNHRRLGR